MARKITSFQRFMMHNPLIQLFKFFYLNIKILIVVAAGHGGTRK
ncbi:MAG: hypothetical protein N4A35_10080 [Flavobacteriales bacterium]|jgi:hypothetical protein|nr:hypothetical protein [Flavobacteriales bacterium]